MLTIKTKQVLVDFQGKPLTNGDISLTLGAALANVVAAATSNSTLSWVLGKKFATEDKVDLKAEEVVFLKKEIEESKTYLAIVKGQLIDILDNTKSGDK